MNSRVHVVRHNRMQHHIDRSPFIIGNVSIKPQSKVQLLGVTLDSDLSMASHVSRTVSTCFFQLHRLKSIRRSLPIEASKSLVSALVFSRCDNQNGLFAGIAKKQVDRLQRSQRVRAAHLRRHSHCSHHAAPSRSSALAALPAADLLQAVPNCLQSVPLQVTRVHQGTAHSRFSECSYGSTPFCAQARRVRDACLPTRAL